MKTQRSGNSGTGSLHQAEVRADWSGRWVWASDVETDRNAYALFRREFSTAGPETLSIHVTANNVYWLTLDGEFIGRGPVRSFPEYYSFDSFELPVAAGEHCLAAMVHHVGEINATMAVGRPGFLADVRVGNVDLSTGAGWTCIESDAWRKDLPVLMSHFGFWEECDLRRLPAGWRQAGFDDGGWHAPVVVQGPWKRLVARDIPYLRRETLQPREVAAVGVWQPREDPSFHAWYANREFFTAGDVPAKQAACRTRLRKAFGRSLPFQAEGRSYVTVDFGRTLVSGYVLVEVSDCRDGQLLDVSFDERLQPNGAVQPKRSYVNFTDRYVLPEGAATIHGAHPRGFRYVTIDLEGGVLESVSAVEERYPFAPSEAFECPDAGLNRTFRKDTLTLELNTADTFVDCPSRERVHWAMTEPLTPVMAIFGDTAMMRRSLFLHAQSQAMYDDGRLNGFSPSDRRMGWIGTYLDWALGLVGYWLHSGRDGDVRRLLPVLDRLLGYLRNQENDRGLIDAGGYWDWAPMEKEGCLLMNNAWYAIVLDTLARHELFRTALSGPLADRAAAIRREAHRVFWDPARRMYRDAVLPDGTPSPVCSQLANAAAVLAGVCPPETRAELLSTICDPGRLGPLPTGDVYSGIWPEEARRRENAIVPVGTMQAATVICRAFFEQGLDVEALALVRDFWGEFDQLPTHPEVRITGCNTFLCHFQGTGAAGLLVRYVLGLQPTAGGWREALFSPHPGDLTEASGRLRTPHGDIAAQWTLADGRYRLCLEIPAGVRVRVAFRDIDTVVRGTARWEGTAA